MPDSNTFDLLTNIGLTQIHESVMFTDEPKLPTFVCEPNNNAINKFICNDVYGQGSSYDEIDAKIKSIGEFFERLCIYNPHTSKLINSKYNRNDQIDPKSFICYSNGQFKNKKQFLNTIDNSSFDWFPVHDLINNKTLMLPAQLIYLNSDFNDGLMLRREQITTGAAFNKKNNDNLAFKSGFLEVIERDAYITSYLTKRKIPEIKNFPKIIQNMIEYLDRYKLKCHVFDITTDLNVPTFMTITIDDTGIGPAVDVGTSSGYDYTDTIYHSIKESIQARRVSRFLKETGFYSVTNDVVKTMQDRYYYWYEVNKIKDLNFWLNNNDKISYDRLPTYSKSLQETKSIFSEKNYHIYVADITIDELKCVGFEVLKVIIPELHPLYLDERAKSLFSIHGGIISDDITLKPHPFA